MNEDKSVRYHRLHGRARIAAPLVTGLSLAVIYGSGVSHGLARLVVGAVGPATAPPAQALHAFLVAALLAILSLPLARYAGLSLERRYGLSRETAASWFRAYARSSGVAALGVAGFAILSYQMLPRWPHTWWLWSGVAAAVTMAAFAMVAPLVLVRFVLRARLLERPALTDRLTALARRAALPVVGVYEWALGERSSRANAALVGIGAWRRVILSDTLLAACTDDEVEVILAHELGHVRHRDILRGMVLEAGVLTAGLGLAALVLGLGWRALGLTGPGDLAGLPLLLLCAGVVTALARPGLNAVSRRNERRADEFAFTLTGRPEAFISAMRKIGAANLADPDPSPMHVLLFHTHPTLDARIAAARRHAAAGPALVSAEPGPAVVSGQ